MTANPRVITGPHFITTSPNAIACAHCRRPILAATVGGLDRHIDPAALTPAGELTALLARRTTYDLNGDHLIRRTVHRIAAGRPHPVVADHTCTPTDPDHLDHTHLQAAIDLVRQLLGAHPVTTNGDTDAPPF